MSELTEKDVRKVAKLARIEVSDDEVRKFTPELQKIVGLMDELSEVNTDGVEPIAGVGGYTLRFRDNDDVLDGGVQEQVLENAPKSQFGCFAVPKVVDAG